MNDKDHLRVHRPFLLKLVLLLTFLVLYQYIYIEYLHPMNEYLGVYLGNFNLTLLVFGNLLALLPGLYLDIGITRPSGYIVWILYVVVYMPSQVVPVLMALQGVGSLLALQVGLFAGFMLIAQATKAPLIPMPTALLSWKAVIILLGVVTAVLYAWLIVENMGHMKLVTFSDVDVYDLRAGSAQRLSAASLYAIAWLTNAINPMMMGWGLFTGRRKWFLLGALGQLLLFSINGMKVYVVSIFILWVFYRWVFPRLKYFGNIILVSSVLLLLGGLLLAKGFKGEDSQGVVSIITMMILLRTFGMPGVFMGLYHDYFSTHAQTLFAHVKGVDLFLRNPHSDQLGVVVGGYYSSNDLMNYNAHFLASDGFAGFGGIGVLLMSLIFYIFLRTVDTVSQRFEPSFLLLCLFYLPINFADVPFFTSLLTGGVFFNILFLLALQDPRVLKPVEVVGSPFAGDTGERP